MKKIVVPSALLVLSVFSAFSTARAADPISLKATEIMLSGVSDAIRTESELFATDISDLAEARGREKRDLKRSICPKMNAGVASAMIMVWAGIKDLAGMEIPDENQAAVQAANSLLANLKNYVDHGTAATKVCAPKSKALAEAKSNLDASQSDLSAAKDALVRLEDALK